MVIRTGVYGQNQPYGGNQGNAPYYQGGNNGQNQNQDYSQDQPPYGQNQPYGGNRGSASYSQGENNGQVQNQGYGQNQPYGGNQGNAPYGQGRYNGKTQDQLYGQYGGNQGNGAYGQEGNNGQAPGNFARVTQMEEQDFGIEPVRELHSGPMHGPTPTRIPGGLVVTTEALFMTLQKNPQGILIFDVLGGNAILPGAVAAAPASQPGSFNDQTQQEFGKFLQQATNGNKAQPILFYCQSPQCWMSYNAALRAINLGYSQVLWYRGGIEAWQMAGLPTGNPYGY